ncbi:glycosyltransferase [Bacillus lacus]|uniref:Glycosyltransferase n=1 Tax=Metabacillus lacus TaxID=1983721 RepID=A0A7X2IWL0_9BACI|nr:glycosyltransferase [Metabacillus lacus]MRX71147.1 glycosyltransferase [Metabacillus lacus]
MNYSIVIATYNRLVELAELLESIVRQSVRPKEVIIVNDAGESVEVLSELYPELSIKITSFLENKGHVEARNTGVRQAAEDIIMLCDDDDLLTENHAATMLKALRDADLVYSDVEIVEFQRVGSVRVPVNRRTFAYLYDHSLMRRFSTYVPSGSMYKKKLHEEIGFFDKSVHNYWDWDFMLRAASCCRVKRVPVAGVLYAFSAGGDNQSASMSEQRKTYLDRLSKKHNLGELPTKNFFLLLEEPEMKALEQNTLRVWNGAPFRSRLI